jgi:hypothetical protein
VWDRCLYGKELAPLLGQFGISTFAFTYTKDKRLLFHRPSTRD